MIIFGVLPILIGLVYGTYVGNPADSHIVVDSVVSFVMSSKWIQLALLLTMLLGLSVAYSAFKYRKVPEGTAAGLSAPGFGPLLALIALCLAGGIVCSGTPMNFTFTRDPVAPAPVTVTTPVPVPTVQKRPSICDDKLISHYQRRQLNCP